MNLIVFPLQQIGDKDKFRIAQESFQAQLRAESMVRLATVEYLQTTDQTSQVRAANSLLSITHSMKLLLLLSDEAQIANRRDAELNQVHRERDEAKAKVSALLDELLRRPQSKVTSNGHETT
jgi:mediator of RNA polymerase II transcription subunit 22